MQKLLWLILVCMLGLPSLVWANGETLYVRDTTACANNGDGTAYGCAASGGAVGAYRGTNNILWNAANTVGQADPGDTLFVCGLHSITSAGLRILPTVSGTAGLPITISGACQSDAGILDGAATSVRLINLGTPVDYITVTNLTIQNVPNTTDYALSGYDDTGAGTRIRNIIISDNTFSNIGYIAAWLWGANWTVTGNTFTNIGEDAVHIEGGANTTVSSNTFSLISMNTTSGDCIQFNQTGITTGTVIIRSNYCDKRLSPDVKYGILAGPVNGPIFVEYNTMLCPGPTTVSTTCNPIYVATQVGGTEQIVVRGNRTYGGWRGVTIQGATGTAFRHQFAGNVIEAAGTLGAHLDADTTSFNVTNNTFVNNEQYGLYLGNPSNTIAVRNNIFKGNAIGLFYTNTPGNGRTYNDWFGQTTRNIDQNGGVGTIDGTDLTVDPLFVSSSDYRTRSNSPVRRAGTPVGDCIDVRGRVCYVDKPDIGAYQATSGDEANTRAARQ